MVVQTAKESKQETTTQQSPAPTPKPVDSYMPTNPVLMNSIPAGGRYFCHGHYWPDNICLYGAHYIVEN